MDIWDRLDQQVLFWFQAHRSAGLDPIVNNVTDLGSRSVLLAVVAVTAIVFLCLRRWRTALLIVGTTVACSLVVDEVKVLVRRERPPGVHRVRTPSLLSQLTRPETASQEPSFSFPSSHSANSAGVYALVVLIVAGRFTRRPLRLLVIGAGLLLVLVIGLTRLYLGAHYLTDVVGGWALGMGFAILGAWLEEWWTRATAPGLSSTVDSKQ